MSEAAQRAASWQRVVRMRRIATGMLGLMALVFALTRPLRGRAGWLDALSAFAEAATVGALADWFAVTALFRHPLGLPIPHTAILPRSQARVATGIAQFLEQHFMTRDVLAAELARWDFAAGALSWLEAPEARRALAQQLARALPASLHLLDQPATRQALLATLDAAMVDLRLGPLLAEILSSLMASERHFALLERFLILVGHALEQHRPQIRQKVHQASPKWLPRAVDDKLFERIMEGVHAMLTEMRDESSEWRPRFDAALHELIERLRHDAALEARLHAMLREHLGHPLLAAYASQAWQALRARLEADVSRPDSATVAWLDGLLGQLARQLAEHPDWCAGLNTWLRGLLSHVIHTYRHAIAAVAEHVVQAWDAQALNSRIELLVGRDLQFIRLNGTIVGGLAGLGLHGIGLWLGHGN